MLSAERDDLRTELAAAAARLIAEDGLDYASAKRTAAQLLGTGRRSLPDNAVVEQELRRYLALFMPEQAESLRAQRQFALNLMRRLECFQPHLVGAVLNGTATSHSNVHLQLFVDSEKEVELFLLDQGLDFGVLEGTQEPGGPIETLCLAARLQTSATPPEQIGVILDIIDADAIRVGPQHRSSHPGLHPVEASGRANVAMLERLIAES